MPDDAPLAQPYAPEGKAVVRLPEGTVKLVDTADAARAGEVYGATPANEAQYFGAATGKAGEAYSALAGTARSLTFGVSDPLMVEGARAIGGDDTAEDIRHLLDLARQANPRATLGGEIAGAALPMFFGKPPGLSAESALGRAIVGGTEGAMIGGAAGLGHQLSEDTLGDHKFVAENYLTAGLKGGALGALMGGGAHLALGGLGAKGAVAEETAGEKVGSYFGRAAEAEAPRAERPLSFLESAANQAALRATGAKGGDIRRLALKAEDQASEIQRYGGMLREQGIVGESIEPIQKIAARVDEKIQSVGEKLGAFYKTFDEGPFRPSIRNIGARFDEEVRAVHSGDLMAERNLAPAEDWLAKMQAKGGEKKMGEFVSFEKLQGFKKEIDAELRKVYEAPPGIPTPPGKEALLGLRDIVREELETAGEAAARDLGEQAIRDFRTSNKLYSDLKTVQKITSSRAAQEAAAPFFSFSDLARAAIGGAFHPMGLGVGIASAIGRRYGAQTAAYALGKASHMEGLVNASRTIEDALSNGTKRFLEGGVGKTRPPRMVTADEVRAVREATRNPEAVQARASAALGDLPKYAPMVAQAASTTATRAAVWLQAALPKERPPIGLGFTKEPRPLSDSELARSTQILEVVADPTIVVDRLLQGRLTAAHVQTLEAVYPETYRRIQTYIRDHGADLRPKLTVQQEAALSLLFKQPLNDVFLPGNVRALQASFTTGNQAPKPGPMNKPSAPLGADGGGARATPYDKMESSP